MIPTSGSFGLGGFSSGSGDAARRSALVSLLDVDRDSGLTAAAQDVMSGALSSSASLNPILINTTTTVSQHFTRLTTSIASQLLAIAKVIEARSTLGSQRQVFLASLGSFDTHTNELDRQQTLFAQLDPALAAFHGAMTAIGAGSSVTSFTLSDFSRTSVDQYAASLAAWFGADATALESVLPNLAACSPSTLGFIQINMPPHRSHRRTPALMEFLTLRAPG